MGHKFSNDYIFPIACIVLAGVIVACLTEVKDLECSKTQNICNIYDSKGFSRKLEESFKITDIKGYSISHYQRPGKYFQATIYNVYLELDDDMILLPFDTRSKKTAENIYTNIMIQPEYKIKGSFFKSFFDLY